MASSLQALPPWCLGSALGSGCDATWDDYPGTTYAPLNVSTDNDFLGDFPLFSPDFALSDNDLLWGTMQPDPLLDSGSVDNDRMEQTGPVSSKSGRLLSTDWPDKEWNPTFETNMTPEQYSPTPDLEDCDDSGDYFSVKSESSSPLSTFSHRNLAERQTNDSSESSTRKDVKSTFSIRKRELPHLKDRDRDRTKKLHNAIERKYRGSLNSKFSEIDNWLSRHQSDPDDCEFTSNSKFFLLAFKLSDKSLISR